MRSPISPNPGAFLGLRVRHANESPVIGATAGVNNPSWSEAQRLGGLRRFAIAISILNLLGHTVFGFEQAWITPLLGLASAYSTELLFEVLDAMLIGRRPKFLGGGVVRFIDFFLSAHIKGLAVGMLLYANERPRPVVFAAATAIASKNIFRARIGKGTPHFFNPSNLGICPA